MKKILVFCLLFFMFSCSDPDEVSSGELCLESNPFCHNIDGLLWSDVSKDYMFWDDAVKYCEDLGGRMPTIDEIRTLIRKCPGTITGGNCGIHDDCTTYGECWNKDCSGVMPESTSYSVFGDTAWLWSSTEIENHKFEVWFTQPPICNVKSISKDNEASKVYVRCVL